MVKVAVIGLGKIGLPLAVQAASRGLSVMGVDVDTTVVTRVNNGEPPFPGEPGLAEGLEASRRAGKIKATMDGPAAVAASEVVVVVVPLVVGEDRTPQFAGIDAATGMIGQAVRRGTLVIYETTLPVGTTRGRFASALARESQLELGRDLFVAHSPERVSSGSVFRDLRRYPKLVGGIDHASGHRAAAFYERALDFDARGDLHRPNGVWDLGSSEAAEMTKLAETTYRDLNIAYANELATAADRAGIDVRDVIQAANSQPYSHIHSPGIAVGGHCIPVYPWFLLGSMEGTRLPLLAREVNDGMPAYGVDKVAEHLGGLRGRRVAVLGLAYRGDVKEAAFSGAFGVVRRIVELGGDARVHDPLFTDAEILGAGLVPHKLGDPVDAVILQTDHSAYGSLAVADLGGAKVVLDGRGCVDGARFGGITVLRIGSP